MFGRIGAMELVIIFSIALLIFGPAKLPEMGKSIGRAINEFKGQANKISEDVKISDEPQKDEKKQS
ncbi:MAG: twin-arginine translocase TatA/TatE family subunit [Spirochaeta sp.]|jgi:sec-independent protein translocase protein TatA|nr:twin-arginine translocase TatA/TatE family subunit [Spirochaeta sp.]